MSATACWLRADLSEVRVFGATEDRWSAPASPADEAELLPALRARAVQAARWTAGHPALKRRLGLACVDVDDALCAWVRAPSATPQVMNAHVRTAGQDWNGAYAAGGIDLVTGAKPAGRRPRGQRSAEATGEFSGTILSMPDALTRLWLDELDRASVRPDGVVTLWHAMALAWAGDRSVDELTAVVLVESESRVVWAWSTGGRLVAAGRASLETHARPEEGAEAAHAAPADPLARLLPRLAIDWLTWSVQLGTTPARAVIVGSTADGQRAAGLMRERWSEMPISVERADDPVARTVVLAAEAWGKGGAGTNSASADRCLPGATTRATRAVKTRYRLAALGVLAVAVAVGGVGWRVSQASASISTAAAGLRVQGQERVSGLSTPLPEGTRNVLKALESRAAELLTREPPKLPPGPRALRSEAARVLDELAKHEGVKIMTFTLEGGRQQSVLHLSVPDRRTSEAIIAQLETAPNGMSWRRQDAAAIDKQLRLQGSWAAEKGGG